MPTNNKNQIIFAIVICGCLIMLLSFGMRATMGFFIVPLSEENGWNREIFAFSIALQNLVWGITAPLVGYLVNKFGNIKIIVASAIIYGLGLILSSSSYTPISMHIYIGIFMGIGISGTSFGVVLPAMIRLIDEKKRGLVLGIGTAAGSFGQFAIAILSQTLINEYGVRDTLFDMGVIVMIIVFLSIPLAKADSGKGINEHKEKEGSWEILKIALTYPSYWFILLGFYVCGFHLAFITAHMPAFLLDKGFSANIGAVVISIIGIFNVIGAYTAGYLSQKYKNKHLLFWIYLLRTFTIAMILFLPLNLTTIIIFSIFTGLLWLATIPPTTNIVSVFFGTKHMAMLYGFVFLSHQLGSFTAIWLGGYLFDTTQSYELIWWGALFLALFSAFIHIPVVEKPYQRIKTNLNIS